MNSVAEKKVLHPELSELPDKYKQIALVAINSPVNRHAVRVRLGWDDAHLDTRIGQNTLIEHHVLNGGVGPLAEEALKFLKEKGYLG
ncbi:MAG: hypothetical protein WCO10_01185 [bacterium]